MIIVGTINLYEMLKLLNNFLYSYGRPEKFMEIHMLNRCTDACIENLLSRPIVFFLRKGSLNSNNGYEVLNNHVDNIEHKEKYDDLFEMNVQCGHALPSTTLNKYVHWDLIPLLEG